MKNGLDNYIMGVNDPSAPFNQVDLDDKYPYLMERCLWVTDEIWENNYEQLEQAVEQVYNEECPESAQTNRREMKLWEMDNAERLSSQVYLRFEQIMSPR